MLLFIIVLCIAVTGILLIRRTERRHAAEGDALTGWRKIRHDIIKGVWAVLVFFALPASFFFSLFTYDYYRIFTEKRIAYVTEVTGITSGADVHFRKYMTFFGGPDGTTIVLELTTTDTPSGFMESHCKGTLKSYTSGGYVFQADADEDAQEGTPLSDLGYGKALTGFYTYSWGGKRYYVVCTDAGNGQTAVSIRY